MFNDAEFDQAKHSALEAQRRFDPLKHQTDKAEEMGMPSREVERWMEKAFVDMHKAGKAEQVFHCSFGTITFKAKTK